MVRLRDVPVNINNQAWPTLANSGRHIKQSERAIIPLDMGARKTTE